MENRSAETKKTFGAFLLQRRRELGLTQKELARQLYVTDSAVSKWERGLAYPDITLLQSICQVLQCSEKELLTASEDTEGRRAEQLAQRYLRFLRVFRVAQYGIYGAVTAGCFLGNLLSAHRLDWFFLVLAAEALCASLTLLPVFVPKGRRGAVSLGAFTLSLVALLWVSCLYTGGDWFLPAAVGSVFGLGLVFLPGVLHTLPLPEQLAGQRAAFYVGAELLLLVALLGVSCLYTGGDWFVTAALWSLFGVAAAVLPFLLPRLSLPGGLVRHKGLIYFSLNTLLLLAGTAWSCQKLEHPLVPLLLAAAGMALPWGWLGAVRYLPPPRLCRVGTGLIWTGLWCWLAPVLADRVLTFCGWPGETSYSLLLSPSLTHWSQQTINDNSIFLALAGCLTAGAICWLLGLFRRKPPQS